MTYKGYTHMEVESFKHDVLELYKNNLIDVVRKNLINGSSYFFEHKDIEDDEYFIKKDLSNSLNIEVLPIFQTSSPKNYAAVWYSSILSS